MDRLIRECVKNSTGLSDRARALVAAAKDGTKTDSPTTSSAPPSSVDFDTYETEDKFTARLQILGCSLELFKQASDPLRDIACPEDARLEDYFAEIISSCHSSRDWTLRKYHSRKDRRIDFGLALPTLQHFTQVRLRKTLEQFEASAGVALHEIRRRRSTALCRHLMGLCSPVLVTEMHALSRAGGLRGRNPSDRFKDFVIRHTMDSNWVTYFCMEYPVLMRLCWITIETRAFAVFEILQRYLADRDQIARRFSIDENDQLVDIEIGQGDTHQDGRSVAILHFSSGARLVYKPRSLRMDIRFQELLGWLAVSGLDHEFRHYAILDQKDYAWTEFVRNTPCQSQAEVERFFYRQGAVLAVLHLLGGYDMIHENVIASGEHPYCIDVECAYSKSRPISDEGMPNSSYAKRLLMESVTSTGMLPRFRQGDTKGAGFVGGGLAIIGGQTREGKVPGWIHENTDEMSQVLRKIVIESENTNLPHLEGVTQNPVTYLDEIVRGFEHAYRILKTSANGLVAEDGLIARLMACPTRVLFRPTSTYSQCQNFLLHPNSLINGLSTTRKLESMWRSTSAMLPPGVVQSELDQLWCGDVPFFVSDGNSRNVLDHKGRVVAENYFVETGPEKIHRRLRNFGESDLKLQLELIEQSLRLFCPSSTSFVRPVDTVTASADSSRPAAESTALFLGAAATSAERILGRAHVDGVEIGWIGPKVGEFGTWKIGQASPGLYDGLGGYCMFYLYLYDVQRNERHRDIAVRIWNQILLDIEHVRRFGVDYNGVSNVILSGYHGLVSVLYVMAHVRSVLGDEYWDGELADFILEWAERRIPFDRHFDFLLGSAGAIPVFLECLGAELGARGEAVATACGNRLLDAAEETPRGICWYTNDFPGLGGFAHGTAGMMVSLQKLAKRTSEERFLAAGRAALAYDRSLFYEPLRSWLCLLDGQDSSRPYWCHGSAGIALSRMLANDTMADPLFEHECRIARDHIIARGLGGSHCLCHGDFGNLEILLKLSSYLEEPDLEKQVLRCAADRVGAHLERDDWPCGITDRNIQLHGMMVGTLGVAYALLRFAAPSRVPSVLSLEPPRCGARPLP